MNKMAKIVKSESWSRGEKTDFAPVRYQKHEKSEGFLRLMCKKAQSEGLGMCFYMTNRSKSEPRVWEEAFFERFTAQMRRASRTVNSREYSRTESS